MPSKWGSRHPAPPSDDCDLGQAKLHQGEGLVTGDPGRGGSGHDPAHRKVEAQRVLIGRPDEPISSQRPRRLDGALEESPSEPATDPRRLEVKLLDLGIGT